LRWSSSGFPVGLRRPDAHDVAHVQTAIHTLGVPTTLEEHQCLAAYMLSESPWLNLAAAREEHLFCALARHRFRRMHFDDGTLSHFYADACAAAQVVIAVVERWALFLTRARLSPGAPSPPLPLPEGQYIFRGYRLDPLLPQAPPSLPLPLASFTTCPVATMQFACRAVQSMHYAGFIDPRTGRIFGAGTSGLHVLMIGRVSPHCALAPLGPVAFKAAEHEVLSASIRFVETYRRPVLNPAISVLSEGRILPIQDATGASPDSDTEFLRSRTGILFAPYEVLFISGEIRPLFPRA